MTADCWALVTVCALLSDILVYLLPDYGMRFLHRPHRLPVEYRTALKHSFNITFAGAYCKIFNGDMAVASSHLGNPAQREPGPTILL